MKGHIDKVNKIKKVLRFFSIYGFERTYVKVMGRVRSKSVPKLPISIRGEKNIALIGCGQFGFATIGYFIMKYSGSRFCGVYDIDKTNASSFTNYYGGQLFTDPKKLINHPDVKYVYIASNHASHTDYAIEALKANKIVYVEKPISVNNNQFEELLREKGDKEMFVGYNRPFSPAIQLIKKCMDVDGDRKPLSLSCFITGHKIPKDHWYRDFQEGTRVCGNIGHWLDLTVHMLNHIGLPNILNVKIHSSSQEERDDNMVITITSNKEDVVSIMLSSREEPFEGINESINIQYSRLIGKIDDFRKVTIWNDDQLIEKRFRRKDVGHKNAILQPFKTQNRRDFKEVEISTRLMLEITNAVRNDIINFDFSIKS